MKRLKANQNNLKRKNDIKAYRADIKLIKKKD